MIDELNTASDLLHVALDRYLRACSAIRNNYAQGNIIKGVSLELEKRVASELLRIVECETMIQQARAAISAARNCFPTLVPITTLPLEILTRIFLLVVSQQRCDTSGKLNSSNKITFLKYPVYLSHVCSHWRQIAIGARVLWSHIDVSSSQFLNRKLLPRAEVYMTRSGQCPLDIHIVDSHYHDQLSRDVTGSSAQFLAPIANRIKSLELELGLHGGSDGHFVRSVLSSFFANCIPGSFTQLCIRRDESDNFYRFIEASENPANGHTLLLNLPKQTLENLWLHITVLQLKGLYPFWTSKAYHGLVELRLDSKGGASITESDFVVILTSSPGLRVLDFSLELTNPLPTNASSIPVRLNNLEIVISRIAKRKQLGSFLKLIAPGSKLLQVSIINPHNRNPEAEPLLSGVDIKEFFARSNIVQICGILLHGYSQIAELLNLAPGVQSLVLDEFEGGNIEKLGPVTTNSLHSLYLLRCRLRLDDLRWLVKRFQIRTILLWQCSFRGRTPLMVINQEELQDELSHLCPVVRLLPANEPNPVDDWGY